MSINVRATVPESVPTSGGANMHAGETSIQTPWPGRFLRWLRRVHGWMGLWGAMLAITGVLLWTRMRGSRLVMAGLCGTSLGLAVWSVVQSV